MAGWAPARPSIEKKLKELGFKDDDLKMIWKKDPADRATLKKNVEALIAKKREKEDAIKSAMKQAFPGLF